MDRKAIMGIGTLIIFIATILVAAVAAGVIISTSGVLQQKALLVGEQSQNRLINGIQITHVFFTTNISEKTANNMEMLARPEPASGPLNLKTTSLTFFTDDGAYSATYTHPDMIENNYSIDVDVDASAWVSFGDLNDDGIDERIRTVVDGGAGDDSLQVNVSGENSLSSLLPLGEDIDSTGANLNITDLPIEMPDGTIFGWIHIEDASTSTADTIDQDTMYITDEIEGDCSFDTLAPETRFCAVTLTGTDDTAVEYGETVMIYFKLRPQNELEENDEFEIKLFPQDGRSTYILDRIPQVIYKTRINVYP